MESLKILAELYLTFVKIGGFTLGGGYAMIPIIQRETVDIKKWATEEEMLDYIALAQSLPGVIGINTATAVGRKVYGKKGAVAATLGMITPSILIIILIALIFDEFKKWTIIQKAFTGVRSAVVALIFLAATRLIKAGIKDYFQVIIALLSFIAILFFGVSPPYVILSAAIISVLYRRCRA